MTMKKLLLFFLPFQTPFKGTKEVAHEPKTSEMPCFFFKVNYFYFMCMRGLCACVYVYQILVLPVRGQKRVADAPDLELEGGISLRVCAGN